MSLWGKTDAQASKPIFIRKPVVFNPATAANLTDNTIAIKGFNYDDGEAVIYTHGGGAVMAATPSLTSGSTYYVINVGGGLIKLASSRVNALAGTAIDITGAGTGAVHTLESINGTADDKVTIVFVDEQEAQVTANKAKGITGAGWWSVQTYTDAQSTTRYKTECLVAITTPVGTAGDASDDTLAADLAITISVQPVNQTVTNPTAATFSVTASINGAVPLTYQWQKAESTATGTWTNIVGATSSSYTTGVTAVAPGAGDTNGDLYRVVVSGGGISATSNSATLTVN